MDHNKRLWNVEENFLFQFCERSRGVPTTNHAKKRMKERDVSNLQILEVLTKGRIVEGYDKMEYPRGEHPKENPSPVRTIQRYVDGRPLTVAVALEACNGRLVFSVVTVYWSDNNQYETRRRDSMR